MRELNLDVPTQGALPHTATQDRTVQNSAYNVDKMTKNVQAQNGPGWLRVKPRVRLLSGKGSARRERGFSSDSLCTFTVSHHVGIKGY